MAWGSSSSAAEPSVIRKLIPVVVTLIIWPIGWVAYQVYLVAQQNGQSASEKVHKKMDKKNVVFTKDGLRVGVKHIQDEKVVDKTQKYVVKAWNLGYSTEDPELRKLQKSQ